ncbi:MAG: hypothetical protein OXI07_09950 [Gammaproteobacteria bacterium]|nr:hypothetical protein [Gammaproteobacteria bacterium]
MAAATANTTTRLTLRGGIVFGEGRGRVSDRVVRHAERIAREHGAHFFCRDIPGEGWRYWFTHPDGGSAANRMTEQAIRSGLAAVDLDIHRLAQALQIPRNRSAI